jgi:hypothetical protein
MRKKSIFAFIFLFLLHGCASSSALKESADNNEKAGDYYESIGQSEVAKKERELAKKKHKRSNSIEVSLFGLIFGDSDK